MHIVAGHESLKKTSWVHIARIGLSIVDHHNQLYPILFLSFPGGSAPPGPPPPRGAKTEKWSCWNYLGVTGDKLGDTTTPQIEDIVEKQGLITTGS